jgi:transcriptional regulator with XRE-family HTH domain
MDKLSKEKLGEIIKFRRKAMKMTQAQLAEAADIHEKQISRIESGKNYPSVVHFVSLMHTLGVQIADLGVDRAQSEPLYNEIVEIISSATPTELKTYIDVIRAIKGNR